MTRGSRVKASLAHSRALWRAIVLAAVLYAVFAPQALAQDAGLFRTDAYLSITRGSKLTWLLNYDRLVDSLRTVSLFVDLGLLSDSLDANPRGAGGGGIPSDSLDVLMTTGPRLLTESLVNPGTDGDLLMTAGGQATWVAAPASELSHVFWIGSSVDPHNAGDTASYKNVLYATVLHREYPIAHGNAYSALRVNIHIRGGEAIGGYVYNTYSTVLTSTGSGATAIVQGDKLLFRFFPKAGTSTDKPLRLYRVPTGTHVMGSGANAIYGQEIAYINIPAAKFPSSGTVSMEITFSYGVK